MCNPLAIASLVITAAGTYAQAQGQKRAQEAMRDAANAESARQKALRGEANALFNDALGKQNAEAQTQRLADQVAERDAAMVGNQVSEQVVNVPVQGGAPDIVADETAARVDVGNAKAKDEAAAKAAIAAFGDLQLGNALMNTRYGQQQSQLANFMQGSQGVLGTEMQAASQQGGKMKQIGDILVAGGQVAGMASSAYGGSSGWSPQATADIATVNATSNPNLLYAPAGSRYSNPVIVRTPYTITR